MINKYYLIRRFKILHFLLISLIIGGCKSVNSSATLPQFKENCQLEDFEGSFKEVVTELTKGIPDLKLKFKTKEQENTQLFLSFSNLPLGAGLKYAAQAANSEMIIDGNTISFNPLPLPVPPPDLRTEEKIIKKTEIAEDRVYTFEEIRAAQQIIRYASTVYLGASGYAGELHESNSALIILINNSNPGYYLKQYFQSATPEGKALLLCGLLQINDDYASSATKQFNSNMKLIRNMYGCELGYSLPIDFYKEFIKNGELYDCIHSDVISRHNSAR